VISEDADEGEDDLASAFMTTISVEAAAASTEGGGVEKQAATTTRSGVGGGIATRSSTPSEEADAEMLDGRGEAAVAKKAGAVEEAVPHNSTDGAVPFDDVAPGATVGSPGKEEVRRTDKSPEEAPSPCFLSATAAAEEALVMGLASRSSMSPHGEAGEDFPLLSCWSSLPEDAAAAAVAYPRKYVRTVAFKSAHWPNTAGRVPK